MSRFAVLALYPLWAVAMVVATTALRLGRASRRGLLSLCFSLAFWVTGLILLENPGTAALAERVVPVGTFLAAAFVHAGADVARLQRRAVVRAAYLASAALATTGAVAPRLLYGPGARSPAPAETLSSSITTSSFQRVKSGSSSVGEWCISCRPAKSAPAKEKLPEGPAAAANAPACGPSRPAAPGGGGSAAAAGCLMPKRGANSTGGLGYRPRLILLALRSLSLTSASSVLGKRSSARVFSSPKPLWKDRMESKSDGCSSRMLTGPPEGLVPGEGAASDPDASEDAEGMAPGVEGSAAAGVAAGAAAAAATESSVTVAAAT